MTDTLNLGELFTDNNDSPGPEFDTAYEDFALRPLRLYSFVNFYLSDLQRGLQTAHLVGELNNKYEFSSAGAAPTLSKWQREHKTIIILNGGNCATIRDTLDVLREHNAGFPFSMFTEDEQSLNNALTCVGIVFPEFTRDEANGAGFYKNLQPFAEVMKLISSHKLA